MALAILFVLCTLLYCGWFFGRLHEANVEARAEEQNQAAFWHAQAHGLLPDPIIKTRYVDLETGIVLEEHEG